MRLTKFRFIWTSGFRGEELFKSAYQKQELPVVTMFVNGLGRNHRHLVSDWLISKISSVKRKLTLV
jgi:hypothetical protein